MRYFIHYDFLKGQDLESRKKSLHQNIDNFTSYGPLKWVISSLPFMEGIDNANFYDCN